LENLIGFHQTNRHNFPTRAGLLSVMANQYLSIHLGCQLWHHVLQQHQQYSRRMDTTPHILKCIPRLTMSQATRPHYKYFELHQHQATCYISEHRLFSRAIYTNMTAIR